MKNGPASSIGGLISNSTIGYKEAILYQIGAYEKMQILYILDSSLNTLGILEGSIFLRTLRTLNADK